MQPAHCYRIFQSYPKPCRITYRDTDGFLKALRFKVRNEMLTLTSGWLVACDPAWAESRQQQHFAHRLKPDRYFVHVCFAHSYLAEEGELACTTRLSLGGELACAMVQINQRDPVRWEIALCPKDSLEQKYYGYGVETGRGCFMDYDVVGALEEISRDLDGTYLLQTKYYNNLDAQLQNECRVANLRVGKTKANVIAFNTGFGDGQCISYWGYDNKDQLSCLISDFTTSYASEIGLAYARRIKSS